MGAFFSRFNPFQPRPPQIREVSYKEFVESKLYELIAVAHSLSTIYLGRTNVMEAIKNGNRGLVFIAGDVPYSRLVPVCQLCVDNEIEFHVFPKKNKLQEILKTKNSVIMVIDHCNYYALYDLCKVGVEILNDHE